MERGRGGFWRYGFARELDSELVWDRLGAWANKYGGSTPRAWAPVPGRWLG